MPISDSGACRSAIPEYADHYFRAMPINKGTTLDNRKHVGHSLPKQGGRDVARKVIHAKNRRNPAIEIRGWTDTPGNSPELLSLTKYS
jgi:hypothetical protein